MELEKKLKSKLNDKVCLYIERDNKTLFESCDKGIGALADVYKRKKAILVNSFLADKIIGKAAGIILILGKVNAVYGEIMSESAYDLLKKYDIKVFYGKKVPIIINREGNDMCPMEKSVIGIDNMEKGYEKIIGTLLNISKK